MKEYMKYNTDKIDSLKERLKDKRKKYNSVYYDILGEYETFLYQVNTGEKNFEEILSIMGYDELKLIIDNLQRLLVENHSLKRFINYNAELLESQALTMRSFKNGK
jgi:hypothetical protein